jgi:hypothetical protein
MDQYFVDFEVYDIVGTITKWGNLFYETSDTDIKKIADSIYVKISKSAGVDRRKIRFRQFNKIVP